MSTRPQRRHKYIIIRDWLTEQIAGGAFARGEQIPSEHELMDRFKVSRVTARQALTKLRDAGLIEARRGKGYFVSRFTATSSLERLQSFGEMMAPLGVETHSDIIEIAEVSADQTTSRALDVECDAPLIRLVRTRVAGGRTVALSINQFPLKLGRKIICLDLANQDLYGLMESRLGIELAYADTSLDTVSIGAQFASYIGVKKGDPVLRIERVTFDAAGIPLVHECTFSPLGVMKFQVRVPRW